MKDLATVKHSGEWGCSGKCRLLFVLINLSVCLPLEAEIIPAFPISGAAGFCQLHGLAIPPVKLMQMMVNSYTPVKFWAPDDSCLSRTVGLGSSYFSQHSAIPDPGLLQREMGGREYPSF